MIAEVFGMLTDLKSKVDLLSSGGKVEAKADSARAAAPGPTN